MTAQLRVEDDFSGSGHVQRVILNDVLVWSWAAHIDGPLSHDAAELLAVLRTPDDAARPGVDTTEGDDSHA